MLETIYWFALDCIEDIYISSLSHNSTMKACEMSEWSSFHIQALNILQGIPQAQFTCT